MRSCAQWAKFQEAQGGGGGGGAEEVPFAGLNDAINASFAEGKAVLICDPTGKSSSFLQCECATSAPPSCAAADASRC